MEKITIGGIVLGSGVLILRIKAVIKWCKDTYTWLSAEWTKMAPVVLPIVIEIERISLEGPITNEKKKKLAMDAVAILKQKGIIKLNWLQDQILSMVIDNVASRLPSIDISKEVKQVIDELKAKEIK